MEQLVAQAVVRQTQQLPYRDGQFSGGCLCAKTRFSTTQLRDLVYCQCSQCRHWHGGFAAYSATPKALLKIKDSNTLRWVQSSSRARRGFCVSCGSSIFWESQSQPYIGIVAGSIDEGSGLHGVRHIYVNDQAPCYTIDDGLPQFRGSMLV
ncbi:MAG: hypothetical protein ACI9BW_001365 [Gammaproteobacteria bacterium]|jgi:hypothetical protein